MNRSYRITEIFPGENDVALTSGRYHAHFTIPCTQNLGIMKRCDPLLDRFPPAAGRAGPLLPRRLPVARPRPRPAPPLAPLLVVAAWGRAGPGPVPRLIAICSFITAVTHPSHAASLLKCSGVQVHSAAPAHLSRCTYVQYLARQGGLQVAQKEPEEITV